MSQLVLRNKRVKEPGIVLSRNAVSQIPTVKFMQRFEVLAMQGQLPIGRGIAWRVTPALKAAAIAPGSQSCPCAARPIMMP